MDWSSQAALSLPKQLRAIIVAAIGFAVLYACSRAAAQGNEPAISRNVKDFGAMCNGSHDDTHSIQDALIAARRANPIFKVTIPSNCVTAMLAIGSNQWIEFEEGATLRALPGGFRDKTSPMFSVGGENITIKGHHATLTMNREEYTDGEWRAGVYIYQASNVYIDNLKVVGAGGDGFTIKGIKTPENITLVNVVADKCVRNGISIISGRNVTIRGATLTNTDQNGRGAGTHGPWAGLDVEPNNDPGEVLDNISLEDLHTNGNAGAGLQFTLHNMPSTTIKVTNFRSEYDGRNGHGVGLYFGGILFDSGGLNPSQPVKGQILIEGARIVSPNGSGVLWRSWSANQPKTVFRNTIIENPGAQTGNMNRCGLYYNVRDTSFSAKYQPGAHLNVEVDGLVVKDPNRRLVRAVWMEGDAQHPLQADVKNVQEEGSASARVQLKLR
jgi:hypothetical protein